MNRVRFTRVSAGGRSRRKVWVVAAIVACALAWVWGPDLWKVFELWREDRSLGARVQALERENAELARRIQELEEDPEAVEREARKKLGLSQTGEIVYKVIEEDSLNQTPR
ncbi:MAG: septum formation initiator family protein [Candidatus Omnitrophica bacterium]|nr:septum formation initiator family protein [Candidatus Omnitrophota bacterium]